MGCYNENNNGAYSATAYKTAPNDNNDGAFMAKVIAATINLFKTRLMFPTDFMCRVEPNAHYDSYNIIANARRDNRRPIDSTGMYPRRSRLESGVGGANAHPVRLERVRTIHMCRGSRVGL